MNSRQGGSQQRDVRLDLLRFLAIALVLGSHLLGLSRAIPGALGQCLGLWERGGWIGVDLFFVLSGFLVSNLLWEDLDSPTGKVRVVRFLVRRGFKIYPAFYFFTLVATLVFAAEGQFSWPRLGSELFFLQNYCVGWWVRPVGVVLAPGQLVVGIIDQAQWSLAVEEHFYFLLSLLFCALAAGRRPRLFPGICLGMLLACLAFRVGYAQGHEVGVFGPASTWTQFRLDSLFFGALLAYIRRFHYDAFQPYLARYRWPVGLVGALGLLPFFFLQRTSHPQLLITYGLTWLYLSCGCLLLATLQVKVPLPRGKGAAAPQGFSHSGLRQEATGGDGVTRLSPTLARLCRPLAFLGRYSYGIYLWHLLVRYLVWRWAPEAAPWLSIALYLSLSLLVGVATSFLVEVPFLRLRERLAP